MKSRDALILQDCKIHSFCKIDLQIKKLFSTTAMLLDTILIHVVTSDDCLNMLSFDIT